MDEFAAALRHLKAFNRMAAAHPELSRRLRGDGVDFLQWQQGSLYASFRTYHRSPEAALRTAETGGRMSLGLFASGTLACLLSAYAYLRHRDLDAAVFSVDKISAGGDHDFRIDGLYRFLRGRKLAFAEVFHTMLGRPTLTHALRRRRAAVYHEAANFLWSLRPRRDGGDRRLAASLACEEFDEKDRPFVRATVLRLLGGAALSFWKIRLYRRLLARWRPRAVLAIDDTRYYHELCAAARALTIPFYAFQHGHFTKYHAGWLSAGSGEGKGIRPDALYVWSPYWKKELLRLGTDFKEAEIRVGGNPKGDAPPISPMPYSLPPADGRMGLLVPFESDVPFDEVARVMRALVATGRVKIFLKTRPDWDAAEQMRRYGLDALGPDEAEAVPDHASIMDRIHAVAGVYSTFLYDVIPYRKPVFILKTSMDFGEGMVVNGLADAFDALAPDAARRLAAACRDAEPRLDERLERYRGGTGSLQATLEGIFGARP